MAITIKPALRKNPQDKAAAAKYYAQVVLAPEMKQKQIVDQIADRCTLTGSDIKAVLDALMVVIKRNLANGSPVRLGDLGSFRPSVSGKGTEDASKCGASSVKKHVLSMFLLLKSREAVSMYSFSKAGASAANEDGEGGDEKPNPKPDEGGGEAPDPAA